MKTTSPHQAWSNPFCGRVKCRVHFAFSSVEQGSRVNPNSRFSASNSHCGVGHSHVAEEKWTRLLDWFTVTNHKKIGRLIHGVVGFW